MVWPGRNLKAHPAPSPSVGRAAPRQLSCPGPHPTWPSAPPGRGHHSFFRQKTSLVPYTGMLGSLLCKLNWLTTAV